MSIAPGRPEDLPDFRKPPLAETVLSLQFESIAGLTTAHIGLLWQRFRDRFPLIEEQPPLSPILEKFGPPSPAQVEVTVEEKPPVPRLWFLNQDKTELIQVQADRFIHNWRKMQGIEPYPRFEPIRDKFRNEVATLVQFLEDEGMGTPVVNQCEVTYVNHIEPSGVWERHGQMERVLANWSAGPEEHRFLPEAEDGGVRLRFVMHDEAGKPVGRLHVISQSAWKKTDNTPIMVLNLTARGEPIGEGIEGAFRFFEVGRRWIVKGFADLTTTPMHRVWERIDG
jgi:uncharacterized protein (TIGR04255 family)